MNELKRLYNYLKKQEGKKIVFLTTSNRWEGEKELPKSSIIAEELRKKLNNCDIINVSKLKIFPCEGNVSNHKGNGCGVKEAILKGTKDPNKFIAKIASGHCKPNGVLQVDPEKMLDFLHPLAANEIWGVGPKTNELLEKMGLFTIAFMDKAAPPLVSPSNFVNTTPSKLIRSSKALAVFTAS